VVVCQVFGGASRVMIRRPERCRIVLLILAMLALLPASLQRGTPPTRSPAGRVYRLSYLGEGRSENAPLLRPLWDGLRELGYVEGRNLVIEQRYAEFKYERLRKGGDHDSGSDHSLGVGGDFSRGRDVSRRHSTCSGAWHHGQAPAPN